MTAKSNREPSQEDLDQMSSSLFAMIVHSALRTFMRKTADKSLPIDDPRMSLVLQLTRERKLPTWNAARVLATILDEQSAQPGVELRADEYALISAVKLEGMLTETDPEESLPADRGDAIACVAALAFAAGVEAGVAFGMKPKELLAEARSQLARDLQGAGAAKRVDWQGPARDFLRPILARKPWLSHNKAAIELETADKSIYEGVKYRPPDRIQVAKWVRAERAKGLPHGLPPQKKAG